jgi:hypothetical protein
MYVCKQALSGIWTKNIFSTKTVLRQHFDRQPKLKSFQIGSRKQKFFAQPQNHFSGMYVIMALI